MALKVRSSQVLSLNSRGNSPRFRAIAYLHEQGADGDVCASNWVCVNIMIVIILYYILFYYIIILYFIILRLYCIIIFYIIS